MQRQLPPPKRTNLFVHRPSSDLPGAILAVTTWRLVAAGGCWVASSPEASLGCRASGAGDLDGHPRLRAGGGLAGQPGLVAGNSAPARPLLHAEQQSPGGALPDIQIIYFGQTYEYTLPWHNAWVLLGITVPVTILLAAAIGIVWGLGRVRRDRLPLYFLVHFLTLPVLRMLPTPPRTTASASFCPPSSSWRPSRAGEQSPWPEDLARRVSPAGAARHIASRRDSLLAPAAFELARIHPFELSYYNSLIGGPRGAWHRGFELTYWFDAFNGQTLDELNQSLPAGAEVDFPNELTNPMTFQELQTLGVLRGDHRARRRCSVPWRKYDQFGLRLDADPGFQGHGLLPAALRDATLVRPRASSLTACGWRPWPTRWPSLGRGHCELLLDATRSGPDRKYHPKDQSADAQSEHPRLGPYRSPGIARGRRSSRREPGSEEGPGRQTAGQTWSRSHPNPRIRRPSRHASSCSIACSKHAPRHWSRPQRS